MYASLLISLLAAFIAMLGKQWLNRYLRNSGGSVIERCGDRQRKCDGLKKWPLRFFIESLPLMLQAALLLLACGLCRYMWSINASVAYTLIGLTGLGVAFFVAIVIAGTSSYACPFQTPASTTLRGAPKRVRRGVRRALVHIKRWFRKLVLGLFLGGQVPGANPLVRVKYQEYYPWLNPVSIHRTNINDVRCVSWILRNITDPEALDAAIRLAGTIRWFDDGINPDIPYGLIVSTFEACFDPAGKLYPGSRDKAYYSGRAMVWINTLAKCKPKDFALRFPLSRERHEEAGLDPDLRQLLRVNQLEIDWLDQWQVIELLVIGPEYTPSHVQWTSDVLLRRSWASLSKLNFGGILYHISDAPETNITIPLNATLNRLLVWCFFLGSPPTAELLKTQNKSYDTSYFALQITHSALR